MKSKEVLLILFVLLIILSVIAHKLTNKKNKLLSFWLGFSIITLLFSYMIINKNHVVNYSCKNNYWGRNDYNLDGYFLLESYGEYKCGCDLRYNYSNSIVYYNELINILLSFALLFTVGNTIIFKEVLFLQALNTIIYFATLKDYSNMNFKKSAYLGFSSLYTIIPLILIYQLK